MAKWKKRKVDNDIERRIVAGMIVSDHFLRAIAPLYDDELIEVPAVRTVAQWCLDYYEQFEKAPGEDIQDIFASHERDSLDPQRADLIRELLADISSEHDQSKFNSDYLIDRTVKRLRKQSLKHISEDIAAAISHGALDDAEHMIASFSPAGLGSRTFVDPIGDELAITEAFEDTQEPLFRMRGALGALIDPQLYRESFIGILGPEKRGKTTWLIEFAMKAVTQKCRVAFFGVGDMSKNQMIRRIQIYVARRNFRARYCGDKLFPVLDCFYNRGDECGLKHRENRVALGLDFFDDEENGDGDSKKKKKRRNPTPNEICQQAEKVGYKPCTACKTTRRLPFTKPETWEPVVHYERRTVKQLSITEAINISKKFKRQKMKAGEIRLECQPNDTVSVTWIDQQLDIWEKEGFVPDVILVDYADILIPEQGSPNEFRHQENNKWKALRRLSQRRKACVITATQADAESYDTTTLGLKNFSEDKRKYGHVTAMLTLNQTPKEKREGIMRIGVLLARDDDFDSEATVTVLQAPFICRANLASF